MKIKNEKKERRRKLKTHFEQTKILKNAKKKKERQKTYTLLQQRKNKKKINEKKSKNSLSRSAGIARYDSQISLKPSSRFSPCRLAFTLIFFTFIHLYVTRHIRLVTDMSLASKVTEIRHSSTKNRNESVMSISSVCWFVCFR